MKRKIITAVLLLCLAVTLCAVTVSASAPLLQDDAVVLSAANREKLSNMLNELRLDTGVDVAIVTVKSVGSAEATDFTDRLYSRMGYGSDGVLLMVATESRDVCITGRGKGYSAVDRSEQQYLIDQITPDLSAGDYNAAFVDFVTLCRRELQTDRSGGRRFEWFPAILIFFGISLVVGLIVVFAMRRKLKSVHHSTNADWYVTPDTFALTLSSDTFLHADVTKVKVESDSGSSHSGSSTAGKF